MAKIPRKNDIVDYYDSRKISCGLILEIEVRKIRILNDQGKETKISINRALNCNQDPDFPVNAGKDTQVSRLKAISAEREEIKNKIDLRELWEIIVVDAEEITLEDLSDLFFGNQNNPSASASLMRAIFEDKTYFKLKADIIEIPSPDRVQQALAQREKELQKTRFTAISAEFIMSLKNSDSVSGKDAPAGLLSLLEEAALLGRDWMENKQVKDIFGQAGMLQGWDPFRVLVELGVWSPDENITIRSENIPIEFSAEIQTMAEKAANKQSLSDRMDLTDERLISIDSIFTRDIDDALSLKISDQTLTLGIHITDVAHYIDHDSEFDLAIRKRATSIYLPENMIPMIPTVLSEQAASLRAGEVRPAISLLANFNKNLELIDYEILESRINVSERLSYEEADELIKIKDSPEFLMHQIALALRKVRIKNGAIIFKDPELHVHVLPDGMIEANIRDRETPSQILVSELMIFANHLFAKYLRLNEIPAIYRSQPPPLDRIDLGEEYDPVISYRCKKALSRGDLSTQPGQHSTLGLDVYTTGTSPLRRYTDLLIQRQLKASLSKKTPLDLADVEEALMEIYFKLERATQMERERQRYFLLRYLETQKDTEFECVVLYRFPKFYLAQITALGYNAALNVPHGTVLNPRDRLIARIEKVNPRAEKLSMSLVRFV